MKKKGLALSAYSDLSRPVNLVSRNESLAITILGFIVATHSACVKPYNVYQCVPCLVIGFVGLKQLHKINEYCNIYSI